MPPLTRKRKRAADESPKQHPSPNPKPKTPPPKTRRRNPLPPKISPYFPTTPPPQSSRKTATRTLTIPQPPGLPFTLLPAPYGLIQERIRTSLFALVLQAILWNQTRGQTARPILFKLLSTYPSPTELALAPLPHLTTILQPIGLHVLRAKRLIALATAWLAAPPCKERRYRRLHYPNKGDGVDVKPGEVLGLDDERQGWEIAHLPGMGPYALDSFRIFYRDRLRGVDEGVGGVEPEWKRVRPTDKELLPYLRWRWEGEGEGGDGVGVAE
ncbi:hypothetical protein NX059_001098 [Plenodomus lindquistii]|nr:hypothetical protein NX059_001098 [Plenodomus lindquistii]